MSPRTAMRHAAVLAALWIVPAAFAAEPPCAELSSSDRPGSQDLRSAFREGDACVMAVRYRRGIGSARIVVSGGTRALVLRFAGFTGLESLELSSATSRLQCGLERREAQAPAIGCRLDGEAAPGPRQIAGGLEFDVPAPMAPSEGEALELRWVDYWR